MARITLNTTAAFFYCACLKEPTSLPALCAYYLELNFKNIQESLCCNCEAKATSENTFRQWMCFVNVNLFTIFIDCSFCIHKDIPK